MKVGIYCRISSDSQSNNTSIQYQKEEGMKFCKDNGFEYEIYSETISGGEVRREEFDKLHSKLLKKELNGIYLTNWDRLSRDKRVMVMFEDLVKECDCKVFVDRIERNIIDNENDILDYEFRGMLSSMERRNIRRRVSFGKRSKLERGEIIVGMYGIGYKKVNNKIVIDKKEEELIKNLFKTFLRKDCKTYSNLMIRMEGKYKDKGGLDKRINSSSIKRLLSNKNFCGKKNIKNTYNGDIKIYEINIGEIIDESLFNEVQNKLESFKKNNKRNKKGNYLLDNKVYCNGCGEKMWIRNVKGIKKDYLYFMCYTNSKRDERYGGVRKLRRLELGENYGCEYKNGNDIDLKVLEDVVWDYLFQILRNINYLKSEYERKYNQNKEINSKQIGKLNYFKKKILKINESIEDTLIKFVEGKLSEEQKNIVLRKYEGEKEDIEKSINDLNIDIEDFNESKKEIVSDYLEYLDIDLERQFKINRFGDRKEFINKYLEKIELEVVDSEGDFNKKNRIYNIFITLNLKLDEEDYTNILKMNNNLNSKYNFYVLKTKTTKFYNLIHKTILKLKLQIKLSIQPKKVINSKILKVKIY
jgi:DNA invertase Pin-like site-specific DNA recombinase